jgi:CheY-like chemotaxis protein
MHFAVRYALQEQERRKARLRRKRRLTAAATEAAMLEPAPVADAQYRSCLHLLGGSAHKFLRQAKARGYCTYDEINAVLPEDEVSADEIEKLFEMLATFGIELREDTLGDSLPFLDGKRILLIHPDAIIMWTIATALEEAGAEVITASNYDDALDRAAGPDLDGAIMNFILNGASPLGIAGRLDRRGVPIVFYTAFDANEVARLTAHFRCTIVTNPASMESVVSALAALLS